MVIAEMFGSLSDQARTEGRCHEEYLAAVLGRQVPSRGANGTRGRPVWSCSTIVRHPFCSAGTRIRDVTCWSS
jgi:hypothetical protein